MAPGGQACRLAGRAGELRLFEVHRATSGHAKCVERGAAARPGHGFQACAAAVSRCGSGRNLGRSGALASNTRGRPMAPRPRPRRDGDVLPDSLSARPEPDVRPDSLAAAMTATSPPTRCRHHPKRISAASPAADRCEKEAAMARKTRSTKDTTISRGAETGAPTSRESIPDPPGDDRQAGRTGEVTSGEPEFEGLLRAGATPRRDGGVEEHPM